MVHIGGECCCIQIVKSRGASQNSTEGPNRVLLAEFRELSENKQILLGHWPLWDLDTCLQCLCVSPSLYLTVIMPPAVISPSATIFAPNQKASPYAENMVTYTQPKPSPLARLLRIPNRFASVKWEVYLNRTERGESYTGQRMSSIRSRLGTVLP